LPEETIAYYQPEYSLLAAELCVATLAAQARLHGATIHEQETVLSVQPQGSGVLVQTTAGSYRADRVILSAGSWMRPLVQQLGIDLPLKVTKELLVYIQPADPEPYRPRTFPVYIHRFPNTTTVGSGFPLFGHAGVKMIYDRTGPVIDPSDPNRNPEAYQLDLSMNYIRDTLPTLGENIIETVTCRYTMTPDEHFIIDRHPEHPQIIIASPCSGHGFKFGSVIGRILADLAIQGSTQFPIDRFQLGRTYFASHGGVQL
jgi:sarcosine oxidase